MKDFKELADKQAIEETIKNLKPRGIEVFFVETGKEAKNKVLEIIPKGSRVLTGQSQTANQIGLPEELDDSGEYISVRKEYMALDREKDADKIRVARSTPDFIVGSVHAVTKQGEVLIASHTGSQLAAYVSGAGKVIWVVGAQKIVNDLEEAEKRIFEYVLPLESERLKKLYGVGSKVSKLLRFSNEVVSGRVTLILVNEKLGF